MAEGKQIDIQDDGSEGSGVAHHHGRHWLPARFFVLTFSLMML